MGSGRRRARIPQVLLELGGQAIQLGIQGADGRAERLGVLEHRLLVRVLLLGRLRLVLHDEVVHGPREVLHTGQVGFEELGVRRAVPEALVRHSRRVDARVALEDHVEEARPFETGFPLLQAPRRVHDGVAVLADGSPAVLPRNVRPALLVARLLDARESGQSRRGRHGHPVVFLGLAFGWRCRLHRGSAKLVGGREAAAPPRCVVAALVPRRHLAILDLDLDEQARLRVGQHCGRGSACTVPDPLLLGPGLRQDAHERRDGVVRQAQQIQRRRRERRVVVRQNHLGGEELVVERGLLPDGVEALGHHGDEHVHQQDGGKEDVQVHEQRPEGGEGGDVEAGQQVLAAQHDLPELDTDAECREETAALAAILENLARLLVDAGGGLRLRLLDAEEDVEGEGEGGDDGAIEDDDLDHIRHHLEDHQRERAEAGHAVQDAQALRESEERRACAEHHRRLRVQAHIRPHHEAVRHPA
mmetsp:Transcript_135701/g.378011  ORF Transcript_135701/g.378011 Transcript_135701/m.378011 type:complete len:473 (-) Transcript_135701:1967-3385(-)